MKINVEKTLNRTVQSSATALVCLLTLDSLIHLSEVFGAARIEASVMPEKGEVSLLNALAFAIVSSGFVWFA